MAKRHQPDRANLYLADRAKGLTYREIAAKHGITAQRVAQVCGKADGRNFRAWTETTCVYPNLRNWLNENKISMNEFVRRIAKTMILAISVRIMAGVGNGTPRSGVAASAIMEKGKTDE